jgi:putative oxidoreductase
MSDVRRKEERGVQNPRRLLLWGASLTTIASLLHIAIILGGPEWYRFFGAGERMARLAAHGSMVPPVMTGVIATILAVWALYGLSGAGVIRRLPLLRLALMLIAAIYVARAILGIPLVLLVEHPYLNELRARMTFMVVSSAVCLGLGFCYAAGAAAVERKSLQDGVFRRSAWTAPRPGSPGRMGR